MEANFDMGMNIPKPKVLIGEQMLSEADRMARAEIEAERGIVRDEKGGIVRTPEQVERRIAELEAKITLTKATAKEAKALITNLEKVREQILANTPEEEQEEALRDCDNGIARQQAKLVTLKQRLADIKAKIEELK